MNDHQLSLLVQEAAPKTWHRYLEQLDGNIYHSVDWAETMAADNRRPLFFFWTSAGRPVGLAIGVERWSHLPLIGRRLKHLSFETYPAVKKQDGKYLPILLEQLLQHARKSDFLSLEVNSFLTDMAAAEQIPRGYSGRDRIEFSLDLGLTDEELLKNMATRHKRKIKKARKHDLIFREATSMEALREFRKLQLDSRQRRIERGESIGMLDDSYYENLGKEYFERQLGRVFLLLKEEEAISAAFVTIYAGKAYYTFGGSSDLGFQLDAPPLLFYQIFSRCRQLGCHHFNMGGVPAEATDKKEHSHGLYLFKAGFGGREIPCRSLRAGSLQPGLGWLERLIAKIR